jgi:putative transposase
MRYSGSEKLEIIRLVEQSTLSVCHTLASIGIPRSTFYGWYSRYQDGGIEALEDPSGYTTALDRARNGAPDAARSPPRETNVRPRRSAHVKTEVDWEWT